MKIYEVIQKLDNKLKGEIDLAEYERKLKGLMDFKQIERSLFLFLVLKKMQDEVNEAQNR